MKRYLSSLILLIAAASTGCDKEKSPLAEDANIKQESPVTINTPPVINPLKEAILMGDKESPVEIYVFTDWRCPACHVLEPNIMEVFENFQDKARFFFIDLPNHEGSLNFIPYNLSFMLNNKKDYPQLREIIMGFAKEDSKLNSAEFNKAISKIEVKYQRIDYAALSQAIEYFQELTRTFRVHATPTLVIYDTRIGEQKNLVGSEINLKNTEGSVEELKKKNYPD